jgi:hypothetical protein
LAVPYSALAMQAVAGNLMVLLKKIGNFGTKMTGEVQIAL